MLDLALPPFVPHRLFQGGHAQTLAGAFLPARTPPYRAQTHAIVLSDGDQVVLHDDTPAGWRAGDRTALLIHGLAGSHKSGYMRRIAHKLSQKNVRVFRMDLRGCGAAQRLSRLPYHSGRSEDAQAALEAVARISPASPTTLVGFSLGANISLKLLGELGAAPCGNLESAMAVCPPIDLAACSRKVSEPSNRRYDRYFVRLLMRQLTVQREQLGEAAARALALRPRTLWDFDNEFTAVACGFGTADNYYRVASAAPLLARIEVPTLILAAKDDPMIPSAALQSVATGRNVRIHLTEHGGHLGFVGRGGADADRRWMDWRVVQWVTAHANARNNSPAARNGSKTSGAATIPN